jgi:ParB family chromosome partitioning protein
LSQTLPDRLIEQVAERKDITMNLTHIPLEQLKLSSVNVRAKGGKDIADLLPSIRSLGIIQPLLVRADGEGFEIVAGQRRFHALTKLAEEGIADPVPVIVMEAGDDAKAIEASLAENVARLPMDEIDQYKAFAAMKAEGLDVAEIAARFGVTERLVSQRLAIAGIIEPILNAYRRDEIRADTLRILTMATPRQQKAWWKLFKSKEEYAPTGHALRQWLFGGAQVPVANALFDLADYKGAIVSDLFGEERYFADAEAFWSLQNAAIAAQRDTYLAAGWSEVAVLDIGEHFSAWGHVKTPRKKGGKVFVAITHDGEVSFHEGWLTEKEARRKDKAGQADAGKSDPLPTTGQPEITKAMRNYLGLHKHAAARTELLAAPGVALRLAVAHAIAGSGLWSVKPDPQRADSEAIATSLASYKAEDGFCQERRRIRLLLGIGDEADVDDVEPIVPGQRDWQAYRSLADIFERLISMEDKAVLRILTFIMAETLEAQSETVEALGILLGTDMRNWWTPDQTFFDLIRDKQAINGMVRETAGDMTADAHVASTAKVQKKIIADCLSGEGRTKVEGWLPRYMAFPATGYTSRFVAPVMQDTAAEDIEFEENDNLDEAA